MAAWSSGLAALAVALVAGGCTDLSGVEPGVCGNRVLDVGEDCDTFVDAALGDGLNCAPPEDDNACSITCDSGFSCPEGWGCGADNVCRQASGTLVAAGGSPWRFRVGDFAIGDVDGDGKQDLVGASQAQVTVRFGSGDGEFPTDVDIATRNAVGPPLFTYFNDDERLDVVLPLFSGVFSLLGQTDGSLLPVPYAPIELPEGLAPDETLLLPVELDPASIGSELLVFVANTVSVLDGAAAAKTLPPGKTVSDIVGRIPIADINPGDLRSRQEFAVAFEGDEIAYIFEVIGDDRNELRIAERDRIALPGRARTPVKFADIDGDGDQDLFVGVETPGGALRFAFALSGGLLVANFPDSATFDPVFNPLAGQFPLATGDFDGDGKADYVTANAVFLSATFTTPGLPSRLQPVAGRTTSNPWTEAEVGDFNGDDRPDIAIATANTDGLVFLLNSGQFLFNAFRVDTDSEPFFLRTGDFDGDLVDDLAYASNGFGVVPDVLEVSFGATSGGPGQPVSMGELGRIRGVEPLNNVRDLESLDAISDLAVVSAELPEQEELSVAVLFGSSQRRLLSPFALSDGDRDDTPIRVAVGNFDGDGARDVVAIAVPQGAVNSQGDLPAGSSGDDLFFNAYFVPGEGPDGGLSASDTEVIELPDFNEFRSDCAEWAVGDLTGDGRDELVGVDRNVACFGRGTSPSPRITVADPSLVMDEGVSSPIEILAAFTATESLEMLDLDADGDLDVLVRFAGETRTDQDDGTGSLSGAGVLILWNNGGGISNDFYTELDLPGVGATYDAEAMNLDDDPEPELVVLTDIGILAADLDKTASPPRFGAAQQLIAAPGGGRMDVGDVNGDGLDDLAWTEGPEVEVFLGVAAPPRGGGELASVPREGGDGDGDGDSGAGDDSGTGEGGQ